MLITLRFNKLVTALVPGDRLEVRTRAKGSFSTYIVDEVAYCPHGGSGGGTQVKLLELFNGETP